MERSKLFMYAVIWNPTEEQAKAGQKSQLLVEPKTILAANEKTAGVMAARDIPTDKLSEIDQIDLVVRPF